MIQYNKDGSVLLVDENNPARTQVIAAGATQAQIDTAAAAFSGGATAKEPMLMSLTAREFLQALVDNSIITAAKRDAILTSLKR